MHFFFIIFTRSTRNFTSKPDENCSFIKTQNRAINIYNHIKEELSKEIFPLSVDYDKVDCLIMFTIADKLVKNWVQRQI